MKNNKIKYNNLNEMFKAIPSNIRYVVLRNYSPILNNTFDYNSDIDILTDNAHDFAMIINAKKCHFPNFRSKYSIEIDNSKISIDIRELGDNYYHIDWQNNILSSRKQQQFLYIPDEKNYCYSLLYHMLIHKNQISSNYVEALCSFQSYSWSKEYTRSEWVNVLDSYLKRNLFSIVIPNDYSVIFNDNGMSYIRQTFINRVIRFLWVVSTNIKNRYA